MEYTGLNAADWSFVIHKKKEVLGITGINIKAERHKHLFVFINIKNKV